MANRWILKHLMQLPPEVPRTPAAHALALKLVTQMDLLRFEHPPQTEGRPAGLSSRCDEPAYAGDVRCVRAHSRPDRGWHTIQQTGRRGAALAQARASIHVVSLITC
jgi:hypothetical protein